MLISEKRRELKQKSVMTIFLKLDIRHRMAIIAKVVLCDLDLDFQRSKLLNLNISKTELAQKSVIITFIDANVEFPDLGLDFKVKVLKF